MNNRRDRLSADMKGTVSVDAAKQNEGHKGLSDENVNVEGQQNDSAHLGNGLLMIDKENTVTEESNVNEDNTNTVNSGKIKTADEQEKLKLDWKVSSWSRCSQTCGPGGKQVKINVDIL